jgi:hypothetical protein
VNKFTPYLLASWLPGFLASWLPGFLASGVPWVDAFGPRLAVEKVVGPVGETAVVELRERYFVALRELYAKTRSAGYSEELDIL